MKNSNISIRRARVDDIKAIYLLLKSFSDQKLLLAKTEDQLFRLIRGFRVIEDTKSKEIVACAHLDIFSEALAEVKSLAVMQDYQGQGLGAQLVLDCEDEARGMNIKKIFALTYQVAFFEKLLYREVNIKTLPEKVFKECVICPFFNECNEHALIKDI